MSEIIMLCGKVCAGKSFYAENLRKERNVVVLSVDELMLSLFSERLGDEHNSVAERCKAFLLRKAEQIAASGIDVLLDFGFWFRAERDSVRARFETLGADVKMVYIRASDERVLENAKIRNADKAKGNDNLSYEADEALLCKCNELFETPSDDECDEIIDVG